MALIMNCPVYQDKLRYDIEHIDEIKDVSYRCLLKNKLGIPRTEKDKKEMDELLNALHNFSSMSASDMLVEMCE